MEQGTGIEPAFTAWEAVVLPIYEPCIFPYYSKAHRKKQPLFVDFIFSLETGFFFCYNHLRPSAEYIIIYRRIFYG